MDFPIVVGTMIEPRGACLTADEIAKHAEFFSFGTNDLTQMTFGYKPRRRRGQVPSTCISTRRYSRRTRSRCLTGAA